MSGRPLLVGLDGRTPIAWEKPQEVIGEKAVSMIVELFGTMSGFGPPFWEPSPAELEADPGLDMPQARGMRLLHALVESIGEKEMHERCKRRWGVDLQFGPPPEEPTGPEEGAPAGVLP